MSMYRCAACGSPKVMLDTQTGGMKYNYVKGAIGDAILGPGGAVAGFESDEQVVFKCPDCGMTLTYSMPLEIKDIIDSAVSSPEAVDYLPLIMNGVSFPMSWAALKAQYKNIEETRFEGINRQAKHRQAESLQSLANATRAEFDSGVDTIRMFYEKNGWHDRIPISDRYSPTNPPSITEYLSFLSAVKIVIENMSKFLPPPLPYDYRGIDSRVLCGCLATYLNEETRKEYASECVTNTDVIINTDARRRAYARLHPFYPGFVQLYANDFNPAIQMQNYEFMLIPESFKYCYTGINPHIQQDGILKGIPSSFIGHATIPLYTIRNGRLGFWEATFNADLRKQLNRHGDYSIISNMYFKLHPEKRSEIEKRLSTFAETQKKYNNAKAAIEKAHNTISSNNAEITSLQGKVFGRAKAQARIAELNSENNRLIKDLESFNCIVKEFEQSDSPQFSLLDEYDWLIPWEWSNPEHECEKIEKQRIITDNLNSTQVASSTTPTCSVTNEIRVFKKLLDDGIITQEEFEVKKRQLLGIEVEPNQGKKSGSVVTIPEDCWKCPKCGRINKNHVISCECGAGNVRFSL